MFDVTDSNSFDQLNKKIDEIRKKTFAGIEIFLIGNKTDLKYLREVSEDAALELKNSKNLQEYLEISCLSGFNFKRLIKTIFERYKKIFFEDYRFN